MVQYTKDNYSFSRELSLKVTFQRADDLGCLVYLVLVIINFAIFGFFVGHYTLFLGMCVLWFIRYIKTADRHVVFEKAEKIAVEVPVRELHSSEDKEGGTTYSMVVTHPEYGQRCSFNISGWVYIQLEKGDLVTLIYAPDLPDYYQLRVDRFEPVTVVEPCELPIMLDQSDSPSFASSNAQYYQDSPPLLISLGITKDPEIAEVLTYTVAITLFITPMFMLMSGKGWGSLLLFPAFIFGFILLEKAVAQWRKKVFGRAEKRTEPALIRGKHRGGNGFCFVVLQHPANGNELTFPFDAAAFEGIEAGQYLSFTYAPEHPGQYCVSLN